MMLHPADQSDPSVDIYVSWNWPFKIAGRDRRAGGGAGGERERWMREREREICDTKMKGEREEIDL